MMSHIRIAIDGPSGAGKSSLSRAVAARLGIMYVDTGALYRTVGYFARMKGVTLENISAVVEMLGEAHIDVKYENGQQCMYLNGENLGDRIRENEISMYASAVGAVPQVRSFLLETQKQIAREHSVIMDGRDIGTVILPDADVKIFMTASPEARAKRRCAELAGKGMPADYEQILADMIERDRNDRERTVAPAVAAPDAVVFDNSDYDFDASVKELLRIVETELSAKGKAMPAAEAAPAEEERKESQKPKHTVTAEERRALNLKHARSRLYAVLYFLFAWLVRLIFRLHAKGQENEPRAGEGAYLVICNHLTWRDPIYLSVCLKHQQPNFMAKKELFKVPLVGPLVRRLGAYPVNRGGADVSAIKKTISMLENGTTVGMFPQGHRHNGEDPRKTEFRSGAAMIAVKAGVPVLPAYIKVKDNTVKGWRRKEVIFGKLITPEEMDYDPTRPGEFNRIAAMLFERVCALGDEPVAADTGSEKHE